MPRYPALCLAASAGFLVAAVAFPHAPMEEVALCLAAAVGLALPVGLSHQRMGLMEGDGSLASPARQRMDLLAASCRWYPGAYIVCIIATVLVVGGMFLVPDVGHPGLAFAAGIAALPGCWFGLVEPVAERLHAEAWRAPLHPDVERTPVARRFRPAWASRAEAGFWLTCTVAGVVLAFLPGFTPSTLQALRITLGVLLTARFISAYTDVGLNGEGRAATFKSYRWSRLAAASVWWPGIMWASAALTVGLLFLAEAGVLSPLDPLLIVLSGLSLLSGLWFLLVDETARRLMVVEMEAAES